MFSLMFNVFLEKNKTVSYIYIFIFYIFIINAKQLFKLQHKKKIYNVNTKQLTTCEVNFIFV